MQLWGLTGWFKTRNWPLGCVSASRCYNISIDINNSSGAVEISMGTGEGQEVQDRGIRIAEHMHSIIPRERGWEATRE